MKVMILAAGAGTRLDPLTLQLPKPLVPIANYPVMGHTLELLRENGFKRIWANLYHLPEHITKYFENSNHSLDINYLVESELSGDAGGVRACRHMLDDSTVVVIMGDLITDTDISEVVSKHKEKKAFATIALKAVDDVSQFGVAVCDKDGWIKEFQEKPEPKDAKSNLVSTGIYVLEPAVFDFIPSTGKYGFGRQLFPDLVSRGLPVLGVEIKSYWSDVGTFAQYKQANFDVLEGKIDLTLPGLHKRTDRADLWLGQNVQIDPGAVLEGKIMLGDNVKVATGAVLSGRVIVGDNSLIANSAQIVNSVIWTGARIGERAKISNSILGLLSNVESGTVLKDTAFVSQEEHEKASS